LSELCNKNVITVLSTKNNEMSNFLCCRSIPTIYYSVRGSITTFGWI